MNLMKSNKYGEVTQKWMVKREAHLCPVPLWRGWREATGEDGERQWMVNSEWWMGRAGKQQTLQGERPGRFYRRSGLSG